MNKYTVAIYNSARNRVQLVGTTDTIRGAKVLGTRALAQYGRGYWAQVEDQATTAQWFKGYCNSKWSE